MITISVISAQMHINKQVSTLSGKIPDKELHIQPMVAVAKEATQPVTQNVTQTIQTPPPAPPTSHEEMMSAAGISPQDFGYVDYIVNRESTWRVEAHNPSGAHGLCQSLPASKMASAGADYMTNPITQLKWCNSYAVGRYGSWAQAHAFWLSHHWW